MKKLRELLAEVASISNLYAELKVDNPILSRWIDKVGIKNRVDEKELHCTVMYSTDPVNLNKIHLERKPLTLPANSRRSFKLFGDDNNVLVLILAKDEIKPIVAIHNMFNRAGASFDYPEFIPHITLSTENKMTEAELKRIKPFSGTIVLSTTKISPLKAD